MIGWATIDRREGDLVASRVEERVECGRVNDTTEEEVINL